MTVDPSSPAARRRHGGREFLFCAPGCAAAFDREPEKHTAPARPKTQPAPRESTLPLFPVVQPEGEVLPEPRPASVAPSASRLAATDPSGSTVTLALEGMHCASCVTTIETALSAVPGVTEASVNLGTARANVRGRDLSSERLVAAVRGSGYGARPAASAASQGKAQKATIVVEGGYSPDVIEARRGVPLRLVFDRRESSPCSDEIVLPDFGVRRPLPAHAKTAIEILPEKTGEFPFSCGMNMLHGKIRVVEP